MISQQKYIIDNKINRYISDVQINNSHKMDKTFNFFKSKVKKEKQTQRNNSKSNSSKGSCVREPEKATISRLPLTKKQRDIRQAIEYRFLKSKLRSYNFQCNVPKRRRQAQSSRSSQMQEYSHLKKLAIVDLKEYHKNQQKLGLSAHSSQEKKKFNLRFNFRQNSSTIFRTQGNLSADKNPYLKKTLKQPLSSKGRNQEWKFISIQLREDFSKGKGKKTQLKTASHQSQHTLRDKIGKTKSNNSSKRKGLEYTRLREEAKLHKSKL